MDDFRRVNHLPIFMANLNVGHGGTYGKPHGGEFAKVATAWLQWQLKGDNEAAKLFVGEPCGLAKAEAGKWKRRTAAGGARAGAARAELGIIDTQVTKCVAVRRPRGTTRQGRGPAQAVALVDARATGSRSPSVPASARDRARSRALDAGEARRPNVA